MAREQFDRIARIIGAESTRRSTLAAFTALGLGGLADARSDVASGNKKKSRSPGRATRR